MFCKIQPHIQSTATAISTRPAIFSMPSFRSIGICLNLKAPWFGSQKFDIYQYCSICTLIRIPWFLFSLHLLKTFSANLFTKLPQPIKRFYKFLDLEEISMIRKIRTNSGSEINKKYFDGKNLNLGGNEHCLKANTPNCLKFWFIRERFIEI